MTKSDRDIERLVEDWLDDEARPLPQHLLESSLEAIARTTQVGRRRPGIFPWLSQRSLALAGGAAVLVLLLVAGPTIFDNLRDLFGPQPGEGPTASPGEVLVWNPATDYRLPPNQLNPSPDRYGNADVWSYMRSADGQHTPGSYFLLPDFNVDPAEWYERDFVNLFVGFSRPDHAISLHGWSDGDPAKNRYAILAWTSPVSGSVSIAGTAWSDWPGDCPDTADGIMVSIDREAETLETFHLSIVESRAFRLMTTVEVGQTLYFMNDPGSDARCDTLMLRLTITNE